MLTGKIFVVLLTLASLSSFASDVELAGEWRGESVCQQKNTACSDEKNVYHISTPDQNGTVQVQADKIMNGTAVKMGTLTFRYDKQKQTLVRKDGPRAWRFEISHNAMSGTLAIDGELVRTISLKKD